MVSRDNEREGDPVKTYERVGEARSATSGERNSGLRLYIKYPVSVSLAAISVSSVGFLLLPEITLSAIIPAAKQVRCCISVLSSLKYPEGRYASPSVVYLSICCFMAVIAIKKGRGRKGETQELHLLWYFTFIKPLAITMLALVALDPHFQQVFVK